jgi:hypothetical protein
MRFMRSVGSLLILAGLYFGGKAIYTHHAHLGTSFAYPVLSVLLGLMLHWVTSRNRSSRRSRDIDDFPPYGYLD